MALNNLPEISDQILEAEKQIELKNFDAARLLLNELICANENDIDALNDLAVLEILTENYDLALTLLMRVLTIDTQNEVTIGNLQYLREKISPILVGPEES